ncbi:MAG: ABC transporter ATP-binding protein [Prevotella sp.]|jgi:ABC-type multidrug transport system fused ATPase/permease subunit|nr:ABC transporter ATP-binding protein [Prevotella sp.]
MRLPNKKYRAKTIVKWLWQSSSDNRLQAILNTAIGLAQVVVSLASVWAVQTAIDIASHNKEGDVISAVLVMAGLVALNFVLNISSVWVRNILGIKAQNRMQRRMLGRILHSEWQGRDSMHSGDVLNRLEQDVNNVVNFVAETLPNAVSVVALFLGAFVYLFTMDHSLALIIVVMFPIFLVLSKIYMGKMRQLTREVRESDSQVQSLLQESVQNRILVKTLESEDEIVDRLSDQHSALREKVVKKTRFSVISNLIVNVGFATGYLVAFAWSALRMSVGSLSYGGMTAFLQLVNKIQNPARNLSKLVPQFVSVFTAAERLMLFEDIPLEEKGESIEVEGPCGIQINEVSFAYPDDPDTPIIDKLSFDFKPGTCTAIVGETGAGKTTLLRMILALIRPDSGNVYIYNKVERFIVSPLTRCNITYVPQGNTMLSGSIRDNLLLGNVDATEEQMYEALDEACADFVRELPDGLDTEMTEQGGGLSEGQAQRICIARALLRNSPLMILDEATSALDPETEKKLLNNILENNSRTVIFITHRPVVLRYCDTSLNLERIHN